MKHSMEKKKDSVQPAAASLSKWQTATTESNIDTEEFKQPTSTPPVQKKIKKKKKLVKTICRCNASFDTIQKITAITDSNIDTEEFKKLTSTPPIQKKMKERKKLEKKTEDFKKPTSTPPVQKNIKEKKKSVKTICLCNASFTTIQKILEALEYQVRVIMKEDPEKAGSVIHLLEDDFAPKLDAIHDGFMTPKRKALRTCVAKKHEFLFLDTI